MRGMIDDPSTIPPSHCIEKGLDFQEKTILLQQISIYPRKRKFMPTYGIPAQSGMPFFFDIEGANGVLYTLQSIV